MELHVWSGDWDLPSIDHLCLSAMKSPEERAEVFNELIDLSGHFGIEMLYRRVLVPMCLSSRIQAFQEGQIYTKILAGQQLVTQLLKMMDKWSDYRENCGQIDVTYTDLKKCSTKAYCKFSSIPISIKKTNNPWRSPSGNTTATFITTTTENLQLWDVSGKKIGYHGDLPVLKYDDSKEADLTKIFEILKKQVFCVERTFMHMVKKINEVEDLFTPERVYLFLMSNDQNVEQVLTAKQTADTMAFMTLLEDKLLPGLLYMQWVDNTTYVDLTRPWYSRAVGLPLSLFLPNTKRKKVIAQLHAPYSGNPVLSDADLENQIVRDAKECLNVLSVKLGNNSFFFDDRPTKLDAIVFGYLAPLLKMPLSNPLQVHLKACRNLVNLCQKILTQYFPLSPEELRTKQKQEEETAQRSSEDAEYPHRKRNMFLAGLVAAGAMAAYALLSGLVQIELVDRDASNAGLDQSENDDDEEE